MIMEAIALILPSLYLIYKQPNLSTTICLAALFCLLLYLGGLSYKFIGTVLAVVIPVCLIFLSLVVHSNVPFLKDYQRQRILAWLEPQKYASSTAYQPVSYTHLDVYKRQLMRCQWKMTGGYDEKEKTKWSGK